MERRASHRWRQHREPDLFEEVGDGQRCRPESGKVAHVFCDAHPLEAFLLSLVPRPVPLFLCQENGFCFFFLQREIATLAVHTPARSSRVTQMKREATELAAPESESGSERSRPPTLLTMLSR